MSILLSHVRSKFVRCLYFHLSPYLEPCIAFNMDYPALTPEKIEEFLRQGCSKSTLEITNTVVSLDYILVFFRDILS